MTLKALLTDRGWADYEIEREILAENGIELVTAPTAEEQTLIELAKDVSGIGTCWGEVTAAVMQNAPLCKTVVRYGIGLDNIDVAQATDQSIVVSNVPDYCVIEVAEHTLAFLLACSRRITLFDHQAKAGKFERMLTPPIVRLTGQTLGLLGFGRIAREVYKLATALGLKVIAHTPSGNNYGLGCQMVGLEQLLQESDYLSLHSPLSESTHHLMDTETLSLMKPTAYLLNTSRGGLVNHEALEQAISQGQIAGAALDVFEPEPPDLSQPLYQDERVIVSPHAAFVSEESLIDLRKRATTQLAQAIQGVKPENVVNPQVYHN